MASISISIGLVVQPWVHRYLQMVKDRAVRTKQVPLLDVVELVCLRGIGFTSTVRCARCGGDGHTAAHCPLPADERDLDRGLPPGPSQQAGDTGRNEREIAPVSGPFNS
jgi:hypothetical protein